VLALTAAGGSSTALSFTKQDVTLPMDDGAKIAATLYRPSGTPPASGWPALVFMHGLAGNRQQMNTLGEASGFAGDRYVVLTFDARGHGESTGLVSIDGPREIADVRALESWLAARPDVDGNAIGAWGISYGGGAVLNSLVAGVPWAAVATVQTWTSLYAALVPQGLVKSGLVAGLAASIPESRRDPSLAAVQTAAFAGDVGQVLSWTAARSSLAKLASVRTPVFMAQGRRDFLFGIDQGTEAYRRLRGPKFLYIGLHGHAPSTFPAADTGVLLTRVHGWFDRFLKTQRDAAPTSGVAIAPENFRGRVAERKTLPETRPARFQLHGNAELVRGGKVVRRSPRLRTPLEVFGAPTVQAKITARAGWSRLVAVLSARTPQGKEIVVSAGGVPTAPGTMSVTIDLINQATYVPKGSRFVLTLGSSSLAQSASNLLYLDLPMRPGANASVGDVVLRVPHLRRPITR
jgi:predicted acyl esterase